MKKLSFLLIILIVALVSSACSTETVTLRCDGDNCENTVEVKIRNDDKPDENWVVFCKDCANNVLDD